MRYGARMLLKNPGVTLVAVLTLALGIGANTAIFSVVNFVLLRPLEYANPDQLVMVWERNTKKGWSESPTSFANFLDFRDNAKSVELAAFTDTNFNLTGGDQPERVAGLRVSANLFSMLGVNPARGRWFAPGEDKPGAGHVLMLSYGLWQRTFGGNSNLVNTTIQLNGQSYTVVGVMPPAFKFPPSFSATVGSSEETVSNADVWVPLTTDDMPLVRDIRNLKMIGRLKPGFSAPQAQSEINAIASRLDRDYPDVNAGIESHVIPLHEQVTGDIRLALMILMAAVALVLLIACANVANLLLAKATSRQKEIAIRTALGANRLRILRQLLTESVLLGALGGLFGLLFAIVGAKTLIAFVSESIPRLKDLNFDSRVLLFTLAISLITSLIFGLAPAIDASKPNLNEALKEGGRSSSGSAARNKLRSALVIAEVALAVVLVTASGLMFRSFVRLQRVNPGFNPENLLTLEIELPEVAYRADQQQRLFQQQLLQKIRAIPGVQFASTVDNLPFSGNAFNGSFMIEGRPVPAVTERPRAFFRVIGPDYFSAMGIRLVRGNQFSDRDTPDAPGVAIINDAAARKYWPGEDALGKRIKRGRPESKNPWLTITGIVGSANQLSLREETQPEIYLPYLQNTSRTFTLVARSNSDPRTLAAAIRKEVWATDKDLPVSSLKLMDELISNSVAQPRFYVILLSVFAALALILAAVGVYGVMAYSVTLRTRDIGIRMALGARPSDIFKHIVGQALMLAAIGLGVGVVLAITSTRAMSSLLFGINATDPLTLGATVLVLLVVALLASYIPARRATKVDPMVTLRYE
jgi:putative ABC transport system permease protein